MFVEQESLQWSIAGNLSGSSPNVLSELEWSDVRRVGFGVELNLPVYRRILLEATFAKSKTFSGKVMDTDYADDNRTNPVFMTKEKANEGHSMRAQLGFSIQVIEWHRTQIDIGFGYGVFQQSLYLTNGSSGLNSSYKTTWYGPTVSSTIRKKLWSSTTLAMRNYYEQSRYSSEADWNLIDEFQHPVSFTHKAKGFGWNISLTIEQSLSTKVEVFCSWQYELWTTGAGVDKLYLKNGSTPQTQLNDVTAERYLIKAGVVVKPMVRDKE